jgi:hypothetical protein
MVNDLVMVNGLVTVKEFKDVFATLREEVMTINVSKIRDYVIRIVMGVTIIIIEDPYLLVFNLEELT